MFAIRALGVFNKALSDKLLIPALHYYFATMAPLFILHSLEAITYAWLDELNYHNEDHATVYLLLALLYMQGYILI